MWFLAGEESHDKEGRVITAEFDKYYFVTACKLKKWLAILPGVCAFGTLSSLSYCLPGLFSLSYCLPGLFSLSYCLPGLLALVELIGTVSLSKVIRLDWARYSLLWQEFNDDLNLFCLPHHPESTYYVYPCLLNIP